MPAPRLVMKFGGTSVADITRIRSAAARVKREVEAGYEVAVVVSAMSGETNRLVDHVRNAADMPGSDNPDSMMRANMTALSPPVSRSPAG